MPVSGKCVDGNGLQKVDLKEERMAKEGLWMGMNCRKWTLEKRGWPRAEWMGMDCRKWTLEKRGWHRTERMGMDCRKWTLEKRGWLRKDYGWEWLGEVDRREERMAKD